MVDYITIGIKTLLGKSDIIPSHLRLLSPTRYVYIRKELDLIILNKNYCKIEYDLLTNGKKMEDYMEYIGGLVMLVPRIETGYKIDKEYRKIYIPLEKIEFRTITQGNPAITEGKPRITQGNPIDNVKRLEENIRTRRVLDILRKRREEKKRKRKNKKRVMRSNYCGFKWGFLL
jgi:hypothetical protein